MTIIGKTIATLVATVLSLALFLAAGPASANPGIDGGLTPCIDLDENGFPQCDDDEPEDEDEDEDPELPPADVDDVVVADPTFTG